LTFDIYIWCQLKDLYFASTGRDGDIYLVRSEGFTGCACQVQLSHNQHVTAKQIIYNNNNGVGIIWR
jgi:hypothetical protein